MKFTASINNFQFPTFQKIVGNLFFIVLLIYSIVYAVERVTYVDSAWQFFQRVNSESFFFPSGRIGVFFSELPLFIAIQLQLPFPILVYVFSISYILLYYIVWRICTYRFANSAAGLLLLFSLTMGVRESFLHTVTETHQCLIYTTLLFSILNFDFAGKIYSKIVWACFTACLVLLTHPIGAFTIGFVCIYYFIEARSIKQSLLWIILSLPVLFTLIRFLSPLDQYDSAQFELLKNSIGTTSFFESASLNFIKIHFTHFYWLPELAGLITLVWLFIRKEWLKLFALLISVIGYLIIACITFNKGDSSIMLERIFLPAFFMISLVFAELVSKKTKMHKLVPMLLVLFFLVNGIHYINVGCLYYKKRVAYIDQIVQHGINQGEAIYFLTKLETETSKEKILVPWALGTETLIYSKFKYNKCISISTEESFCKKNNFYITNTYCFPIKNLNANYFQLNGETTQELKH